MQKFFTQEKLLSFAPEKQIKALYDLASFAERSSDEKFEQYLHKLSQYHLFLKDSTIDSIQKLNKEFNKVKNKDYQFQVYLMILERLLGQTKKDYQMMVQLGDDKSENTPLPILCILDSIRSAHNIGAMFRNAECFKIEKLVLTGLSPTPEHSSVQKTAMGTDIVQPWEYHKSAINYLQKLKEKGYSIWAIETGKSSIPLKEINSLPEKTVLLFGHEIFGLSMELIELSDKIIHIPLRGNKNSLNVSIAQAIVLNHLAALDS